jgi:hypothetical protein
MGYRSDVALVFYPNNEENYPALKLWFDEVYPHKEAIEVFDADIQAVEGCHVLVSYSCVKWYDDFEHVKEVRKVIENYEAAFLACKEDYVGAWEFVRVGEDWTDIEHEYSASSQHRLGVSREIYFS